MSLTKVGIVIRVVISNATVAQCADWFGQHLFDSFSKDLTSPTYEAPAPDASPTARRIPSAPFDSPPFPSGDWQIGATPIIGDPGNVGPWPLMEAIYVGFMISGGLFSDQLLKDNDYYGFDMPMVYFDVDVPNVFQGMNVRVGRIISEPDIEAQLAPNNLMSSHSIIYGFDNYTQRNQFVASMDFIIHY